MVDHMCGHAVGADCVVGDARHTIVQLGDLVGVVACSGEADGCEGNRAISCVGRLRDHVAGGILQLEGELSSREVAARELLRDLDLVGHRALVRGRSVGVGDGEERGGGRVGGSAQRAVTVVLDGDRDGLRLVAVADTRLVALILGDGVGEGLLGRASEVVLREGDGAEVDRATGSILDRSLCGHGSAIRALDREAVVARLDAAGAIHDLEARHGDRDISGEVVVHEGNGGGALSKRCCKGAIAVVDDVDREGERLRVQLERIARLVLFHKIVDVVRAVSILGSSTIGDEVLKRACLIGPASLVGN